MMRLFRKHLAPDELGAMIYEALRAGMASGGAMSLSHFVEQLQAYGCELHEQYVGEIMVAAMFAATLAIERSTTVWMGRQIERGMSNEFFRHLEEQGAGPGHVGEWKAIVTDRGAMYRHVLADYEGFEPPWKLGRQFLWNMTGVETYVAIPIKTATLYLLSSRDVAQHLLNQYGPTLLVNLST